LLLALLRDPRFYAMKLRMDRALLDEMRSRACRKCGKALHAADFGRKPRGGPAGLGADADLRFSLCCARCRKRHTPPSVRFLGRKVYWSAVVVLVSAMRHGASPARMRRLREHFGVSRRTVERWRVWWREAFAESAFWKAAVAAFMPPVVRDLLPASLLKRFTGDGEAPLVAVLRFLGPITGGAGLAQAG
jgi:hypothetical protein